MARMKMSLILLGALILVIISVVSTYLVLLLTHVIPNDPINIEITIQDKEKAYDGTPLMADSYEITDGKLLDGHNLELTYKGSITDAGTIKSSAEARVFDEKHTEHTNEYSFTIKEGNLVIKKQSLEMYVTDEGNSSVDYGASFELLDESALCPGHKIVPHYTFENILGNTEELKASMTAQVFDVNGHEVTKNYDLKYVSSNIKIKKTVISFRTLSKTKVYDGDPFDETQLESTISYGALPEGYTYDVTYDYRDKGNVGTTALNIETVVIKDNYGDDVSNRFDVQKQNTGILTITPYEINVVIDDKEFDYDGTEHTYTEFTISDDPLVRVIGGGSEFEYLDKTYEVDVNTAPSITNVGTRVNDLNFTIINSSGDNVTSNFKVSQNNAVLKVNKRRLVFNPSGEEYVNGVLEKPFIPSNGSDKEYTKEFFNDAIKFSAGDILIEVEDYNYGVIYHAGDYQLTPTEYTITGINEDELKNFEIIINPANIKITRANVYIIIESGTFTHGSGSTNLDCEIYMDDRVEYENIVFYDYYYVDVQNVSKSNTGTYSIGCILIKEDDVDALLEDFNIYITNGIAIIN